MSDVNGLFAAGQHNLTTHQTSFTSISFAEKNERIIITDKYVHIFKKTRKITAAYSNKSKQAKEAKHLKQLHLTPLSTQVSSFSIAMKSQFKHYHPLVTA